MGENGVVTEWAYEQACTALSKHRARVVELEQGAVKLEALVEGDRRMFTERVTELETNLEKLRKKALNCWNRGREYAAKEWPGMVRAAREAYLAEKKGRSEDNADLTEQMMATEEQLDIALSLVKERDGQIWYLNETILALKAERERDGSTKLEDDALAVPGVHEMGEQ